VGEVISAGGHSLGSLLSHARVLARLETLLRGFIGAHTTTQLQVANLREDRLILITPTATSATRLRLQTPQLLSFLQSSGYAQLRHIDIRVAPPTHQPEQTRLRRRPSVEAERTFKNFHHLTSKPEP